MDAFYTAPGTTLYCGDSRALLPTLPAHSVDAVVTDPPAGIAFMGREWDHFGTDQGHAGSKSPANRHAETSDIGWERVGYFKQGGAPVSRSAREPFIAAMAAIFRECLRVLKPGGHALVWALPRTSHWTATALEDAGFEVRDVIVHLYGQGFPKSLDVGKALDKTNGRVPWREFAPALRVAMESSGLTYADIDQRLGLKSSSCYWVREDHRGGLPPRKHWDTLRALLNLPPTLEQLYDAAEREVVGQRMTGGISGRKDHPLPDAPIGAWKSGQTMVDVTAPATDLARQWDGWGTALKPAMENWILCRAPLSESTIAANVARWGTGALNIDGGRLPSPNPANEDSRGQGRPRGTFPHSDDAWGNGHLARTESHPAGRWPPNVCLSHTLWCAPAGVRRVRGGIVGQTSSQRPSGYAMGAEYAPRYYAAPDGTETVEAFDCVDECPVRLLDAQAGGHRQSWWGDAPVEYDTKYEGWGNRGTRRGVGYTDTGGASRFFYVAKSSAAERSRGLPAGERNGHPTVKPLALMRWLLTLIVPPGGTVLDPFAGSGSTLVAAAELGIEAIGIEQDETYAVTARARLTAPPSPAPAPAAPTAPPVARSRPARRSPAPSCTPLL